MCTNIENLLCISLALTRIWVPKCKNFKVISKGCCFLHGKTDHPCTFPLIFFSLDCLSKNWTTLFDQLHVAKDVRGSWCPLTGIWDCPSKIAGNWDCFHCIQKPGYNFRTTGHFITQLVILVKTFCFAYLSFPTLLHIIQKHVHKN